MASHHFPSVTERSRRAAESVHADAQELLDRIGGVAELSAMYDRLTAVIAARPDVRVVRVEEGHVDLTYRELLRALS